MAIKLSERIAGETKVKRIYFGQDGTDPYLDIEYRLHAMSHGRKQMLMGSVFSLQDKAKRIKDIQRILEDKNRPEQDRENASTEMARIMQDVQLLVPPLADYLGGVPDNDPPRPPAIVKWDLLDDQGEPLPITREVINELDEEMISRIAWELLGDSSPGEAKGSGSSKQSEVTSQATSTVPA